MNQEAVLAVLPHSKDDAKSLKEIAQEMGLFGSGEEAERDNGHKFWYNAYWKTDPAK